MSTTELVPRSEPILTKSRLGWAGLAAFIGCAACCAVPWLTLTFAGTGAATTITSFVRPGSELVVGGVFFTVALAVMAIRRRMNRSQACGPSCKIDGRCCDHGTSSQRSVEQT
jgi:hypothetical protein